MFLVYSLLFIIAPIFSVETPLEWQEQCAFSHLPISGEEGFYKAAKLRGVTILIRHGERSGLLEYSDDTGCPPFTQEDELLFQKLQEKVSSSPFQEFIGMHIDKLGNYSLIPERARCAKGQLTAEGFLQHIKLGEYLLHRYHNSTLLLAEIEPKITLATTNYNRTLQSLIALTSSFLFPLEERVKKVDFKIANNTIICFSENCHCPYANVLWRRSHQEEYDTFVEVALPHVVEIARNLTRIPEFATSHEGHQIIDTALTRFVCRKRELPCFEGNCLTYDILNKMKNFTSTRGVYWYKEAKYMRGLVDDIKTSNFFTQYFDRIDSLENNSSFIDVISAHDVTIGALFHSLGVKFIDPPRYASRVIFETFEKEEKLLFRMLYNGEDWTSRLDFCTSTVDGLCSVDLVREFFKKLKEKTRTTRSKCFTNK